MGYPVVAPTQIQYDKGEGIVAGVNQGIANYFKAGEQARQNRLADIQAQNADLQGKVMQFNLDKAAREMEDEKKFDEIAAGVPTERIIEEEVERPGDPGGFFGPYKEKVQKSAPVRMSDYYGEIAQKASKAGLSKHALAMQGQSLALRKQEVTERMGMYKQYLEMAKGNPEMQKAINAVMQKDEILKGSVPAGLEIDMDTGTLSYPIDVTEGNPILMYNGDTVTRPGRYKVKMIQTKNGPRAIEVVEDQTEKKYASGVPIGNGQVASGLYDKEGNFEPFNTPGGKTIGPKWKDTDSDGGGGGGLISKAQKDFSKLDGDARKEAKEAVNAKFGKSAFDPMSGGFVHEKAGSNRNEIFQYYQKAYEKAYNKRGLNKLQTFSPDEAYTPRGTSTIKDKGRSSMANSWAKWIINNSKGNREKAKKLFTEKVFNHTGKTWTPAEVQAISDDIEDLWRTNKK